MSNHSDNVVPPGSISAGGGANDHPPADSEAAIIALFRAGGHRATPQRLALAELMREQGGFMDADELLALATLRGHELSQATVYRTLALFKDLGLVEGRIVGDDQDREEYRFRSSQTRYTLTCKRCGAIVPVESDIVERFRQDVTAALGVIVTSAHTCFIGYCPACTAALAAEEAPDRAPGDAAS